MTFSDAVFLGALRVKIIGRMIINGNELEFRVNVTVTGQIMVMSRCAGGK